MVSLTVLVLRICLQAGTWLRASQDVRQKVQTVFRLRGKWSILSTSRAYVCACIVVHIHTYTFIYTFVGVLYTSWHCSLMARKRTWEILSWFAVDLPQEFQEFISSFHVLIILAIKGGWPTPLTFVICHEINEWKLIFKHHPNPPESMKILPINLVAKFGSGALILNLLLLLFYYLYVYYY